MPSPLDRLIDAAVRCLKCGKAGMPGTCGCWVRLECPCCDKSRPFAARDQTDPPNAVRVVFPCDECPQEAVDVAYFDAEGRQIDCGGNPLPQAARRMA